MQPKAKIKKPIVGEIIEVTRHPNADRLYVAQVNTGDSRLIAVIFGGSRQLKPQDLVAIALPGTRLPSGEKIRPRNFRKVRSCAELLSKDELLGTKGGPDELLVLPATIFKIGDVIDVSRI